MSLALAVDLGRAVDVSVRAELLDDVDRRSGALVPRRRSSHVLGADPDGDRAALSCRPRRRRRAGQRARSAPPNFTPPSTSGTVDQVHRGGADEAGHEHVVRAVVHVARGVDLLQDAVLEHGDPVAHGHGLDLVVGDVDRGDAEAALQRGDLRTGLHAQLGVEVGQRLVHEEDLRLADDRAAHRDTLALTTGERLRLAVEVLLEVEDLRGLVDPCGDLVPCSSPAILSAKPMLSATVMCGYSA